MQNPVFKLEKVVRSKSEEEMQDFEGPLDLILYLLGKNKMEIQDISISLICDQYLQWLEQRQKMDLEVASEFVTMASHLVYIKTRMLLSIEDQEAQSEMDALIQSLEERRRSESYGRIKAMAARLAPMGEFGRNILTRDPEPVERGKIYEYHQQPADLVLAMAEIQNRAERRLPPPQSAFQAIVRHEPYPVESKAKEILQRLKRHGVTQGDFAAAQPPRRHPVFAAVPGQPQPQRGGGNLPGGAGAVPGPRAAPGRVRDGLHRPPGRRCARGPEILTRRGDAPWK